MDYIVYVLQYDSRKYQWISARILDKTGRILKMKPIPRQYALKEVAKSYNGVMLKHDNLDNVICSKSLFVTMSTTSGTFGKPVHNHCNLNSISVYDYSKLFPLEPLENCSSWTDLGVTSQPNLVVESGAHPSLHPKCHYQIVFAEFNLMISYPPPYSRKVWHYREVNTDYIREAITNFNWEKAFYNTNVTTKVSIFNETLLNVLRNYVPHEILTCDDKDLPWFNSRVNLLHRIKISFTCKSFISKQAVKINFKTFEGVALMLRYLIN